MVPAPLPPERRSDVALRPHQLRLRLQPRYARLCRRLPAARTGMRVHGHAAQRRPLARRQRRALVRASSAECVVAGGQPPQGLLGM